MHRFHFTSPPFTREIKIENRLKLPPIESQIEALKTSVEARQSATLVAPAGSGKTVVLRALYAQLAAARYAVTYIKLTNLAARDMCREVAAALGLEATGHYPKLVRSIEAKIQNGYRNAGLRLVVLVDDAHAIRTESLQLLRLLTNFDMDSLLVVSMILAGQLPLKSMLCKDGLEDVLHRLIYCGELQLLTREDTRAYIEHRSLIAGARTAPFDNHAMEAIFEITRGNMRAIDKLALASLVEADRVNHEIVDSADVAKARAHTWI